MNKLSHEELNVLGLFKLVQESSESMQLNDSDLQKVFCDPDLSGLVYSRLIFSVFSACDDFVRYGQLVAKLSKQELIYFLLFLIKVSYSQALFIMTESDQQPTIIKIEKNNEQTTYQK